MRNSYANVIVKRRFVIAFVEVKSGEVFESGILEFVDRLKERFRHVTAFVALKQKKQRRTMSDGALLHDGHSQCTVLQYELATCSRAQEHL